MSEHSDLFRSYIVQGLKHLCEEVEACKGQIPEHLQRNAFHLIKYAFAVDAAWQPLRQLLLQLAPKITLAAIPDDWTRCLNQMIKLSRSRQDFFLEGRLLLDLGYVQQRNNQLRGSQTNYQSAAACFKSIRDECRYALSLSRLANIQRLLKNFDDAEENLGCALLLLPSNHPFTVLTYMFLGWIARDKGMWSTSQEYFEAALEVSRVVGDKQREAHLLRDIGTVLQMQARFELAIKNHNDAISILEVIEDEYDLAVAEMNMGVVYLYLENWQCALEWFAKAHPRFLKYHDGRHLGMSYTNQAIAVRGLGNFDKALELLKISIDFFEQIEDIFAVANGLDEIGVTYWEMQQKEKAEPYFRVALAKLEPLQRLDGFQNKYQTILDHLNLCLQHDAGT